MIRIKRITRGSIAIMTIAIAWVLEQPSPAVAQQNLQRAQKLLKQAEQIWKDESYPKWEKSKLSRDTTVINNLIKDLDKFSDFDTSVAWRTALSTMKYNLTLRRTAYRLLLYDKPLPGKSENVRSCLEMLEKYIADTTRTMFTAGADPKRQFVERAFMQRFADCLGTIAEDSSAFAKAEKFLKDAIFTPTKILEILRRDPHHLINFLGNWQPRGDSTALAVAQAMADWIRTDSLAAKKFFERVINSGEVSSAAELLSTLLIRIQDSPQQLAILKKLVTTLPIDKLSQDLVETFSRLTENLEERYIIAILDSMARNAPPAERQKRARVLEMYEKLLKEKLRREDIARFCRKAREFDPSKKLQSVMLIGKLFYPGSGYDQLTDDKRLGPFVDELKRVFKNNEAYEVVVDTLAIKDSITTEEAILASQNVRFAELPPIPDNLRNRPALALVGTYFYTQRTGELRMICRIADASEGIVLLTKDEEFNLNKGGYREKVSDFATAVARALEDEIKRALDLETILNSPLVWDPKKMIAEQFHGIRFGIERSGALDTISLAKIKRVQINEPYWAGLNDPKSAGLRLFLKRLNDQVTQNYPSNILQGTTANAVVLSGDIVSETPFLEIKNFMRRDADTLTLVKVNLQFMHSGQDLTPLDVESGVEIVMLNLEALIPRRRPSETLNRSTTSGTTEPIKKISKWESAPSLLLAGTSQLIVANRFQPTSVKSQKRWGWLFLTAEAALLGAAFAFDQQAIRDVDNNALQTRNGLLIGAGSLGVISAVKAWFDIGGHNRK